MQQILPLPRLCCCCSTLCGRQSVYPGSRSIREANICCYHFSRSHQYFWDTRRLIVSLPTGNRNCSHYTRCQPSKWCLEQTCSLVSSQGGQRLRVEIFYQQLGLWWATLSLPSMPQYCHWLQRQGNFLFFTPYSLLGQLCSPSSWQLAWCWVSCCRALFIITHCLLKPFCCVCCTALRVYARYHANYHLQRGNCLYQGNVIRKECWLNLLITADYCQVMVLNFFTTAQFQSFSTILYFRRLLSTMSLNP